MRYALLLLSTLTGCVAAGGPTRASPDPAPPIEIPGSAELGPRIERLHWLAGCWERAAGGMLTEEQWMRPLGGTILGMSRTVREGRTVEHEALRIYEDAGELVYWAYPSRHAPAEFRSVEVTDSSARFENPEHDFPQAIHYRRVGADSLVASIEGPRNGQLRTIEFPFRKVDCD